MAAISFDSGKSRLVSFGSASCVGFNEIDALNSFVDASNHDGAAEIRAMIQDEESITFHLVGGFLGAGKTTCLLRMAEFYLRQGLRVGIIANDQSGNLVDTELFRNAGFDTAEVVDGCFCCKFDELIAAAGRLGDGQSPNVLLAEPVGSCTDLVATVIKPLRRLFHERFTIAPYVTLLDPDRAFQALTGSPCRACPH